MNRQKSFLNDKPTLYLVGTPIGNYDDMTIRAINILKEVSIIYCEDTRITSQLLKHFLINTPLRSYNVMTENKLTDNLIEEIKKRGKVALVSDAGMPSISDPGFLAAREAIKNDINVVVIPGVSASLTALAGSGIETNHFYFYGFLNSKENKRRKEITSLKDRKETIIIYEAPHRIKETMQDLYDILGDRFIVLSRELTKHYEEYIRGNISEIIPILEEIKGEMVIIIEGKKSDELVDKLNEMSLKDHYEFYLKELNDPKLAYKKVAEDLGISKSRVYNELNKNRK